MSVPKGFRQRMHNESKVKMKKDVHDEHLFDYLSGIILYGKNMIDILRSYKLAYEVNLIIVKIAKHL